MGRRGWIAWIARREESAYSCMKPTSNDARQDEAAANTHPLDGIEALEPVRGFPRENRSWGFCANRPCPKAATLPSRPLLSSVP